MDNTPAFPIESRSIAHGMTLRDYFAAKALQGLLADHEINMPSAEFAKAAYAQADAMMAARGQQ